MMQRFVYTLIIVSLGFLHFIVCTSDFLHRLQEKNNQIITLFSHRDNLKQCLGELIKHEKQAIQIATYNLTSQDVVNQLLDAQKRNVAIEIITGVEGLYCYGQQVTCLWRAGIPTYIVTSNDSSVHHKYAIFSRNIHAEPLVWTGSANFTERGLIKNHENVVVLKEAQTVADYKSDFDRLKKKIRQQPRAVIKIASRNPRTSIMVSLVHGVISLIK